MHRRWEIYRCTHLRIIPASLAMQSILSTSSRAWRSPKDEYLDPKVLGEASSLGFHDNESHKRVGPALAVPTGHTPRRPNAPSHTRCHGIRR